MHRSRGENAPLLPCSQKKSSVAHVVQSSLRRLQQLVKEKDKLIVVLQEAVSAAHKVTLDQHESDQNDCGLLHQLLLIQEDRSVQGIKDALQVKSSFKEIIIAFGVM
ncbi:hypothetical protein R1sor_024009 [Riccia sorocarpa]|uniref:Uncharacterized protein n=1 Tax=Riccia sorocarpa TaxID=122646 RepID=A0ABD3GQ10_9MARC